MKKMTSIRMRIFIPVLILIVLFPVLSWGIFSMSSDWYMKRLSKQSLTELMETISTAADELYTDENEMTREREKELSKELISQIKVFIRKDRPQSRLFVMNSRWKMTYPKGEELRPDTKELSDLCKQLVEENKIKGDGSEIKQVSLGDERYLVSLFEVKSTGNVRNKYMFGYVPVPDTKLLLSYTGTLLFLISGGLALLALGAVWLIAGSISAPLLDLCRRSREIGKGRFSQSEKAYSIGEIEELRRSFDRMTKELEQSNDRQTSFFQNASHELRTPLMSICGYAQGIECNVFPDHKEAAGVILSEAMRMKELVDGILTISRMDSSSLALEMETIDLREFIRGEVAALKGMELMEQISIELAEGGEQIMVSADSSLLSKAFRNILSNCARYAESKVEAEVKKEGGWAVIAVKDDGPGFKEADIPFLFDRFYKGEGGNFGIGLSIVKKAAEYMGGRAEAGNRKALEHGACVSFFLPLSE